MQSQAAENVVELQPVRADRAQRRSQMRLRGALVFVPAAAVLAVSFALPPRAVGHGTHEDLGLPPCSFLSQTGYPCPSCGMTTAFAATAHGRVAEAFLAHPAGPVLWLGLAVVSLAGLAELLSGRDCLRLLRPSGWWAVAALAGMLGGWAFKIAYGLATSTLPVR